MNKTDQQIDLGKWLTGCLANISIAQVVTCTSVKRAKSCTDGTIMVLVNF